MSGGTRHYPTLNQPKEAATVEKLEIRNEQEYQKALARLRKGAEYIESPEFQQKPDDHKQKALERYAQLSKAILKYKGLI